MQTPPLALSSSFCEAFLQLIGFVLLVDVDSKLFLVERAFSAGFRAALLGCDWLGGC